MDVIHILFWPFIACLVLTGIHSYLGLHVVSRGVIFVDLSLAQVAALGTAVAALLGMDVHDPAAYGISLTFALLGALLFSITRSKTGRIPQEAIIGITYAVSAAMSILIMDRIPEGGEHIKHILVGSLLSVTPADVLTITILYSLVGLLHYWKRKPLLMISLDPAAAKSQGTSVKLWDFFFYATFGIVVTSSVSIAGVLLVFSFLIVPPVSAMLLADQIRPRLIWGWLIGFVVSALGMIGSFIFDTPTGATVICVFGLVLVLIAILKPLLIRNRF